MDVLYPILYSGATTLIGLAIKTAIVCLVATPFIKRLIKYAIEEYNKNKKE